ncbi:hypothetical protein C8R46DRAFT_1124443 [Mycena filopes]|nr:hypothetical protein C8R46DRAFT_1124443 [Mycena filopes]
MLARLSSAASQVEFSQISRGSDGDERFSLDMQTFRLVVPVPDINITWGRVAQICERAMNPMYKGLYSILEKDMEHVAQILASLETANESLNVAHDDSATPTPSPELIIIPSPSPSVPTIVITPCSQTPPEGSCQVPIQDSAFRTQLTVPSQFPSLNQSFPPMMPPRRPSARCIKHWIWKNGHWQAKLRTLEQRPRVLKHRRTSRSGGIKSG